MTHGVFADQAKVETFQVRLFDEDESSNDDQIGMAVIDTLTTMIGADHKKEWAQLTYHGEACRACGCGKAAEAGTTKAGEVLLGVEATVKLAANQFDGLWDRLQLSDCISRDSPSGSPLGCRGCRLQELEAEADDAIGRLKVTTLQGSHLKSMDAIGKNDVYAAITVPGKETAVCVPPPGVHSAIAMTARPRALLSCKSCPVTALLSLYNLYNWLRPNPVNRNLLGLPGRRCQSAPKTRCEPSQVGAVCLIGSLALNIIVGRVADLTTH